MKIRQTVLAFGLLSVAGVALAAPELKTNCPEPVLQSMSQATFSQYAEDCRRKYARAFKLQRKEKRKAILKEHGLISSYMPSPSGFSFLRDYKQAYVKLAFDVNQKGNVVNVRVRESSGLKAMNDAAAEAVKAMQFFPQDEPVRDVKWSYDYFSLETDKDFINKK